MSNKNISIGQVLKVFYIIFLRVKRKRKKMYNFIGLCINKNKTNFKIVNNIKREKIFFVFDYRSPVIFKLVILNIYKKLSYRVYRIKFKTKNKYVNDYTDKQNFIDSSLNSFKLDYFYAGYFKKKITKFKKKLRKFKRKYYYTENWKILKNFIPDIKEAERIRFENNRINVK